MGLMRDEETLGFLRAQGRSARYVTSVCTGALLLGAAGLLEGYEAATHWAFMDLLPSYGARPVRRRVVVDRNRITGGGVTAGIDFGLS
jgi:cyclohexyl-isocyanide hydratase